MGKMTTLPAGDYIEALKKSGLYVSDNVSDRDMPVEGLTYNSKAAGDGTLFVCKGAAFKEDYLKEAVSRGACLYVSEQPYDVSVPGIITNNVRKAMTVLGNLYYGRPWEDLRITGITGTKGKTSAVYYQKAVFDNYEEETGGRESGITSSIDYYDGITKEESHNTTPEAMELLRLIRNAVDSGLDLFEMEVSSQALKYDRVEGVTYDVGVFMNISTDHISPVEHTDFEDYFASKLRLFEITKTAVINAGSDHFARILAEAGKCEKVVVFGTQPWCDVYGYDIRKEESCIRFRVRTDSFDEEFMLTMPGLFNVENALAAIAVSKELGIPVKNMKAGLEKARVAGRMELYTSKDGIINAIVDYAHNRLSFEKLFSSVRKEYPGYRVVAVFGSAGGKAFSRRRDLGEVSAKYMDKVFLTEEDPGKEPPEQTMEDIAKYIRPAGTDHVMIADREEAIIAALDEHDVKTVYLVLGKGAETTEKIGTEYVTYPTDVDIVKDYIAKYDKEH
ncbi:MAG: UDP-N-acetylmuramoyl-L-alanyl-D-glutamate--2,6-diaminopimelate ligase [Lachnospiraceae bacterium]|nr:UDP-N-acetylmuramoyl-L-alanyl-D-glutamate--2,6-diaminopimelate ligase [Lachnospiraceae bacterium]